MMPINKKDDGWYWGSKGPFKSKEKAEEVQQAAHASGYEKSKDQPLEKFLAALIGGAARVAGKGAAGGTGKALAQDAILSRLSSDEEEEEDGVLPINAFEMSKSPTWAKDLRRQAKTQGTSASATRKRNFAPVIDEDVIDSEVQDMETAAEKKKAKWKKNQAGWEGEEFAEGMIDPAEAFGKPMQKEGGDGGAAGIGTVAVSSDPGVFTETYGARKKKIMNRSNKTSTKKNQKSGPEKLNDWLKNTEKSLDDETFLVELIEHVGTELRKAGEGPTGVYTPYNERPYKPPEPQEIKRKGKGRSEEINRSPTTENTVPVSTGAGSLGQSNVPQETALAPPGIDDQRNMNRPVPKQKKKKLHVPVVGAFLTPGNESGNNFQNTAVPFTAMQKMPTHGNTTANSPKQFSTERPQDQYIERKPRLDPNSDIEQEEFVGNVDSIKDEDKNRKGRTYENNKEGNNFNTKQIDTYTMNMGGSALQAMLKEMRDIGIDSLHRQSDDDITEPDEYVLEDVDDEENNEIPSNKDEMKAEKAAVKKMMDWINGV